MISKSGPFPRLSPQLRHLFEVSNARDDFRSTLVVVPDFEAVPSSTWLDASGNCWLQTRLPSMLVKPRVLSFEPGLKVSETFQWHNVVEWGDIFLTQLLALARSDPKLCMRPLFFIAHGLGGFILKRMIGVLFQRYYEPVYKELITATSGVIFLGCPNPSINKPSDLERVMQILKAVSKQPTRLLQRWAEDVAITANISQKFSDAGLEVPILSAYERKVTKLGRTIFSPRHVLVDSTLCEIFTQRERLVGLDCCHEDLPSFSAAPALAVELESFFSLALEARTVWSHPAPDSSMNAGAWTAVHCDVHEISARFDNSSLEDMPQSPAFSKYASSVETFFQFPSGSYLPVEYLADGLPSNQKQARLPCYLFGPHERNPEFTGREDILEILDQALLPHSLPDSPGQNELKTFALCGVGGLGKTQIAIEFIYSRKHEYDAIFWVHAADTSKLANDFKKIATQLELEGSDSQDFTELRKLVLDWLAAPGSHNTSPGRLRNPINWLLVFDNAEHLADLRDYWPMNSSKGSILVTSRDPLAKTQTYFYSPNGLELTPFGNDLSAAWLRKLTKNDDTPKEIELSEIIAEKLSNLPLAISRVAGAIQRQNLSLAEFLEFYKKGAFRAQIYQSEYGRMQMPIWSAFAFNHLSPKAASLLDTICFLDPDTIAEGMFTFFIKAAAAKDIALPGFPRTNLSYVEARTELTRCSLLRRNVALKELTVHRLVQDSAIAGMTPDRLVSAFKASLEMLSAAWPSTAVQDWNVERGKKSAPLLPHIIRMKLQYEMNQTLQETDIYNNDFGKLLAEAAW